MKIWSKKEEDFLSNLELKTVDIYEISNKLNRTVGSIVKKLYRLRHVDLRYHLIGTRRRALNRYNLMVRRTKLTELPKNRKYKGVRVNLDKEEFIEWFMKNDFKNASVDRIDKTKDYTMDNIQLIPLDENIAKDKVKARNGYCECYKCHKTKPISDFVVDKRRRNNHSTLCIECEKQRQRDKYKNNTK